jgi:natural product biosynthesis luciferase-like monooxygenase protein
MLIGLLGILKAGGAYIPLDPTYPADRLRQVSSAAGITLLLTQAHLPTIHAPGEIQTVSVDRDRESIAAEHSHPPTSKVTSENLAYVISTSGSTGQPKGVMIEHRNVVNFFAGMDHYLEEDRPGCWLAVTSISFDISVLELCWTLTRGFQVVVQEHRHGMPLLTDEAPLAAPKEMEFSLFYFANDAGSAGDKEKYRLLLEGARFADQHEFAAVWIPERHFHPFGGLYPNPSVLGAALATITSAVQIRAGSVVSPLHHPLRIAEEWAVVDNLSGGRVGLSFASGWHANDFVLAPQRYTQRKKEMLKDIERVRRLWRGESILLRNGADSEVEVRIFPPPVQAELPLWITSAGSPQTFALAAELGANVLTHLLGQSLESLAEKIAVYREAWRRHGHGRGRGHVTLMLHTFVGESEEMVRETVREPFCAYLKSSLNLLQEWVKSLHLENLAHEDRDALLAYAFDRYYESSGLLGTPSSCTFMVERLKRIGVDEIACLIDFGLDTDAVLASLENLEKVRQAGRNRQNDVRAPSMAHQLQQQHISHLQCTPSLASMLAADQELSCLLGGLKRLLLGGEVFPAALAVQLARLSGGELHNMYGPTETTIWSSSQRVGAAEGSVSLGRPLANTQIYLLNRQFEPLPIGVVGEIFIGGEGVARGYLARPDLTAESFLPDPFTWRPGGRIYKTGDMARYRLDGGLEYLGRSDQQIKIRGLRVELGEIEALLQSHPQIETCAVVVQEKQAGEKLLLAYVVGRTAMRPSPQELLLFLQHRLPHYMLPSRYILMDALPLTANGKIDRQALRALEIQDDGTRTTFVAPRTPLEERLAEIWKELLMLTAVGVHDNFFERGGHSLLALRLVSELQKNFHQRIALPLFLHEPTIEHLADLLTQGDSALFASPLVAIQPQGRRAPFFCVHPGSGNVMCYYDLARHLGLDQPFYGLQDPGVSLEEFTPLSIEEMAERYLGAIRAVQPRGPYSLGGYSFGGCVAFEMARQLQARKQEVRHLLILEGIAPTMPGKMKQEDDAIWLAILTQEVIRGSTSKSIAELYADLQGLMLEQQLEYIVEQMRRAQLHVGAQTARWMHRQMLIFKSRDTILQNYRPSTYQGPIALFLTSETDEFAALELHKKDAELIEGWSKFSAQKLSVTFVPGFHDTVLKEPNVQGLADALRAHLS